MASKAQILSLIEHGLPRGVVAERVGVSESYISQVLAEETIKTKSLEARLEVLDERTARDAKYDALEDQLLEKMHKSVSALYKPQDVLRALMAINKAERRGATSAQIAELANSQQSSVIALQLPERIKTKIVKSSTQEVVAVNGRDLITKDSRTLLMEMESAEKLEGTSELELAPLDAIKDAELLALPEPDNKINSIADSNSLFFSSEELQNETPGHSASPQSQDSNRSASHFHEHQGALKKNADQFLDALQI